uniref:Uncharacterized protein n=1 Tax=Arundo donax TaxID=35708 RepID=A0A0A9D923_ARUDO
MPLSSLLFTLPTYKISRFLELSRYPFLAS